MHPEPQRRFTLAEWRWCMKNKTIRWLMWETDQTHNIETSIENLIEAWFNQNICWNLADGHDVHWFPQLVPFAMCGQTHAVHRGQWQSQTAWPLNPSASLSNDGRPNLILPTAAELISFKRTKSDILRPSWAHCLLPHSHESFQRR